MAATDPIPEDIRRMLGSAISRDADLIVKRALAPIPPVTSLTVGLRTVPRGDSTAALRIAQDLVARKVSGNSFWLATQISRSVLVR